MRTFEELRKVLSQIENKICYRFKEKQLLISAFVHRSFNNENQECAVDNERLEFLGDAVLNLLVTLFLYEELPKKSEGTLSYLRSLLVDTAACARYVDMLGIGNFMLMGRGESMHTHRGRVTILADLFEAVMGAIYLDGEIQAAHRFFFTHFKHTISEMVQNPMRNWKDELQDYCQKRYQKPPTYEVVNEQGADHSKTFHMVVKLDEHILGEGRGTSKKEAGQMSARQAIQILERT